MTTEWIDEPLDEGMIAVVCPIYVSAIERTVLVDQNDHYIRAYELIL